MRKMIRRIVTDDEGSALLEGTIVVPVLFSLVFGVLEFSYYFYQQHLVSTGVRDAARYLARVQDPNNATSQTIAQSLASTGSPTPGSTFRRVAGFDPAEVTIAVTPIANVARWHLWRGSLSRAESSQACDRYRQLHLGAAGILGLLRVRQQERHGDAF